MGKWITTCSLRNNSLLLANQHSTLFKLNDIILPHSDTGKLPKLLVFLFARVEMTEDAREVFILMTILAQFCESAKQ